MVASYCVRVIEAVEMTASKGLPRIMIGNDSKRGFGSEEQATVERVASVFPRKPEMLSVAQPLYSTVVGEIRQTPCHPVKYECNYFLAAT